MSYANTVRSCKEAVNIYLASNLPKFKLSSACDMHESKRGMFECVC